MFLDLEPSVHIVAITPYVQTMTYYKNTMHSAQPCFARLDGFHNKFSQVGKDSVFLKNLFAKAFFIKLSLTLYCLLLLVYPRKRLLFAFLK